MAENVKLHQRLRIWQWIVLGLTGILLVVFLLLSAFRKPIATGLVNNWCGEKGWRCEAVITRLSLGGVGLEDVTIITETGQPIEARLVDVDLNWGWLFRPEIASVRTDSPIVRGELGDDGISLYGLETLVSNDDGGGGSTAPIPEVDIREGKLVLATTAGDFTATFEAEGKPFLNGRIDISLPTQSFDGNGVSLDGSGGDIVIDFEGGQTAGNITFDVGDVQIAGLSAAGMSLQLQLSDVDGDIAIDGAVAAEAVAAQGATAGSIEGTILARLGAPGALTSVEVLSALKAVNLNLEASGVSLPELSLDEATAAVDISSQGDAALEGPISIAVRGAKGAVAAEEVALSGDARIQSGDWVGSEFDGILSVASGAVDQDVVTPLLGSLVLPAPLDLHGEQLRATLREALSSFSAEMKFLAQYTEAGGALSSSSPVTLIASSGLEVTASPRPGAALFKTSVDGFSSTGNVSLAGGGGPSLNIALDQLTFGPDTGLNAQFGEVKLEPWTVSGRSIAVDIEEAEMASGLTEQLMVRGAVQISGDYTGAVLDQTSLAGGIAAQRTAGLWHVTTLGNGCLDFRTDGAKAGDLTFASLDLDLCPLNRQLMSQGQGSETSLLSLGDLQLEFSTAETRGALRLDDASVRLRGQSGFRLDFSGKVLEVPLQFGESEVTVAGGEPSVFFVADGGPVGFGARLGETRFGGNLVPFSIDAQTFRFDGTSGREGILGSLDMTGVRISDPRADPLFKPIISDIVGELQGLDLALGGEIKAEALAKTIADASLDVDLSTLTGTADVTMRPLQFQPGVFQPTDLSERLRGVLTDAIGQMTGSANFTIDAGNVAGTGIVEVADLAFKTFNFGTIADVEGRIEFSDALGIKTPPEQQIRIGAMDIGLPLRDGVIQFQLHGPTEASLQGARWPLAGGVMTIQPTDWRLGARTHSVTVAADGVELEQLIDVLSIPDMKVTGRVSGVFPVDIEGANILVRDARFVADAPGGTLSYVGEETEAVAAGNQYAEFAFEALRSLDYTVMELGANGNLIGDLIVTANILGRNPEVLGGAEFKFGITIDSRLAELLSSLRGAPLETYAAEAYELIEENQGGGGR
ncbi:MAG: YdbH domain-containing protein [Pseudomonadota bacterium]